MGVKGACPLMLPPPLGERGGHPRNFHAISKNSKVFLQSRFSYSANPCLTPRKRMQILKKFSNCLGFAKNEKHSGITGQFLFLRIVTLFKNNLFRLKATIE